WRKAADDLATADRLQTAPPTEWLEMMTEMELGFMLAQLGEVERYRNHCLKVLDRWAGTSKNMTAERVLKTCCILGPSPVGDPDRLARLARVPVSGDQSKNLPYLYNAQALYEYRTGRFDAAVATCRANRTRFQRMPGTDWELVTASALE